MADTRSVFKQEGDVVLRPVEKEDAEFLRDLLVHEGVRYTIGMAPKPANLKEVREWIEGVDKDEKVSFIIEFNGEKAGECSLNDFDNEYGRAEIGISIYPDFQDQGIGSRALKMLLEYGFETLNLHCIRGGYLEINEPSRRIMEKAGMREEGRKRDYKYVDGEWVDLIYLSITEDEYFE